MIAISQAHPWHGIGAGADAPQLVNAFIEIVPTDTVKYEVDKDSGHLMVDRPQKYSNFCPSLYGFVPQTYCGELVGEFCSKQSGRANVEGDHDPLDICVLTERAISHGNILVRAVPIGGMRIIDRGQADDKIIAVLRDDALFSSWQSLADCPPRILERLHHYFLTYKDIPGSDTKRIEMITTYSVDEAHEVIRRSREDYRAQILPKLFSGAGA